MQKRNVPFWKIWLSYLTEIGLAEISQTPNNQNLKLSLNTGRYLLSTENAIYSYEDRYYSFKVALNALKPELRKAENALILGFGMGSIAWMLRNHFQSNIAITGVEIDPWITEQFDKYYSYENIHLTNGDALSFLKESRLKFDLIFIDLFEEDLVPEEFQQIAFFQKVKAQLKPNGTVICNYLPPEKENITEQLPASFEKVFTQFKVLKARRNRIFVGNN